MVTRRGHSLVELIVTLAFLGATLGAVAAASLAATRGTAEAVRRQEGLSSAAALLDSLLAHADPSGGEQHAHGSILVWTVTPAGPGRVVRVAARAPGAAEITLLESFWAPAPPILPRGTP